MFFSSYFSLRRLRLDSDTSSPSADRGALVSGLGCASASFSTSLLLNSDLLLLAELGKSISSSPLRHSKMAPLPPASPRAPPSLHSASLRSLPLSDAIKSEK